MAQVLEMGWQREIMGLERREEPGQESPFQVTPGDSLQPGPTHSALNSPRDEPTDDMVVGPQSSLLPHSGNFGRQFRGHQNIGRDGGNW